MFLSSFFRLQISEVSGQIVTKLCHMFGGECNFLNCVKNLGGSLPRKIWRPKNIKISEFAIQSRISPDGNKILVSSTGKQRWKLQSLTPLCAYQIWWTVVHKRRKIGPAFQPTKWTFSDAHISGAKGHCPLKISQLVEDDQRLLRHTSLGLGLPPTIFNAWNSKIGQKSGVL